MINTIIGGLIALISGVTVGILTPSFNYRIKNQKVINQKILELISILYLLRNNLSSYLIQDIYINTLGKVEAGENETQKLRTLNEQLDFNINTLYQTQQEAITLFKSKTSLAKTSSNISLIYDKLKELENFIWSHKLYFNNQKSIFDQESSDEYSNILNKMLLESLTPKLECIIELNQQGLGIKCNKKNANNLV